MNNMLKFLNIPKVDDEYDVGVVEWICYSETLIKTSLFGVQYAIIRIIISLRVKVVVA